MTPPGLTTALVVVVNGSVYERYAADLFESARENFRPTTHVEMIALPGPPGWPSATMMRWHVLKEAWPALRKKYGYVFLSDADMVVAGKVGSEILPPYAGYTATLHPGYVGKHFSELPFETHPESACRVIPADGDCYYAGGFIGGSTPGVEWLMGKITERLDLDIAAGITPVHHDESALNAVLAMPGAGPTLTLSAAYCHPDRDEYYRTQVWGRDYERILVAVDKTAEERALR